MSTSGIKRSLYFISFSIGIQCLAVGLMVLGWAACSYLHNDISPLAMLLIGTLCGYTLAAWLNFSLPWRYFNALLIPAALGLSSAGVGAELLIAVALVFFLTYLPTFWTGVPYYPSNRKAYESVLRLLPTEKEFRFVDLGSGFAGILNFLSDKRPKGKFEGYEISPLPVAISKVKLLLRRNAEIKAANFWKVSLSDYDFVYAFLAPEPMAKLWEKVQAEMRPGSTFITNTFQVDATPAEIINLTQDGTRSLFVFRF